MEQKKNDIFICYSSKDLNIVEKIAKRLNAENLNVFFDLEQPLEANSYTDSLMEAILGSSLFLYFFSESSARSNWCQQTLSYAQRHHCEILPIRIGNVKQNLLDLNVLSEIDDDEWLIYNDKTFDYREIVDDIKQHLHSIFRKQQYDIFISYSRKDIDKVLPIVKEIESKGISVWYDINGIESGEEFVTKIATAIDNSDSVLFMYTENSVNGQWTQKEVMYAKEQKKTVIPILLNGSMPDKGWFKFLYGNIDCINIADCIQKDKLLKNLSDRAKKRKLESVLKNDAIKDEGAIIHIDCDMNCKVLKYGKELCIANVGEYTDIRLLKGRHLLTFISIENPIDNMSITYTVDDSQMEDFIAVELIPIRNYRIEQEMQYERDKKSFDNITPSEEEASWSFDCKEILPFSEGFAGVMLNGKWGYIDKSGKIVIPCIYDDACDFRDGLASVKINEKWGYIDKSGKQVVSCIYDNVGDFHEGLTYFEVNGKWGYIDKSGKIVIPSLFDYTGNFYEGLAWFIVNDKRGFIDKFGKIVIPHIYDDAEGFDDGLARVKVNEKWGYIDKSGKEVIPCIYDCANVFNEGIASVKVNEKWGYIDKSGKTVIPCIYDHVNDFHEGLAAVCFNDEWGVINKSGKEVIPCIYDYVGNFDKGLAAVRFNDEWGFVDKSGKQVTPHKYVNIEDFHEGLAWVADAISVKCGFIDKSGKEVIPCIYDDAGDFHEGLAWFIANDKRGFIDKSGKIVIPCIYDDADNFYEGLASVCLNGQWGVINKNGKLIYLNEQDLQY